MGLRTKAYFIGVFLAVISPMAAALGLGEIKLNSALNQPLNAEIQLLQVRDLTEGEIRIAIASPEEFARAGVERNFFVTDLKFNLDLNAPQGPVVRVTSNGPVREPFLNFIVSARWPSGKLLREYTLLVDLPVFSGAQPAPVRPVTQAPTQTPPAAATPPATPRTTPARQVETPQAETRPAAEPANRRSTFSGDSYGPVGANETLWAIAARVKPDSSVSVQQTMLAIQRMNPNAFINGNINLLRRGQVLRIPDKDEIQQLSSRDAVRQVAEQNRSWNDRTPAPERAQLEGSKNFTQTRTEPSSVEGRVKLSSPPTDTAAGQGTGAEGRGEGGRAAEALTQAQEELDAADRENADLKSRIQAMEEQIQTMERLVEVSSEEMRALELAAQQANQQQPAAGQQTEVADDPAVAEVESPETSAAQPPAEPVEVQPAQPAKTAKPQKSWMDLVMDNILYIGIGLGILALALVYLLLKRKRRDEYEEYDDYDASADMDLAADGAEMGDDKTVPIHDFDNEELVQEERALAEAETEDVVGECDIHIAYGQYDQAEEKLLRALEKDPANTPVRLKLLEVFALQGDADNFDQHYARLRATGDSDAIDRAAVIRTSIEGIEPFDASFYAASVAAGSTAKAYESSSEDLFATTDTLEFDFNDVDDLVDSSAAENRRDELDADSLEFDLTLDDDDVTRIPPAKFATNADAGADVTDDFDLADLNEPVTDLDDLKLEMNFAEDTSITSSATDLELPDEDLAVVDDEKARDDFAEEFDLDFGEERLTGEFADDLVAERPIRQDEESYDFGDLELTDAEQGIEKPNTFASSADVLDFDLDRDIEDAQATLDEPPVLSSAADDADSDLNNLGLDDLEGLDLEGGFEAEPERAGSTAAVRTADSNADFDVDFDLDKDIDLDELDHELDALAPNFGVAGASMEEPVLDFDDERPGSAAAATDDGDAFVQDDLDDLFPDEGVTSIAAVSKTPAPQFESANSGLDFEIPDFDPENDDDSNLDFLSDNDETATKLDLARAYIDMGDSDGAKDILDEIMDEGNDLQKREAEVLLSRIG